MKKILKIILSTLLILIFLVLGLHFIGRSLNKSIPQGGINESMYVEINDTKQWINIYGEDINNPVLLYLHGGPGSATSEIDYAFTRKWADIFTVVTWDQRNCGKSYDKNQNNIKLTREIFMEDGKEMTEFLRKYLGVEKISILGHSWGSLYGANLVLAHPNYYNLFIGTGQMVDIVENEKAFKEKALKWAANDEEDMVLLENYNPEEISLETIQTKNIILNKYGYAMMKDGSDYNLFTTLLFNPNYSVKDWASYFGRDMKVYFDFYRSDEFKDFSLKGKYKYKIPYININGDMDYQANYKLAKEYFDRAEAVEKDLYLMENTSHGLMESKSEEFSELIHDIYDKYKWIYD